MKILGFEPPVKKKEIRKFKCECGCIFEAEKGEYTETYYHGDDTYVYSVICPRCRNKILKDECEFTTDEIRIEVT